MVRLKFEMWINQKDAGGIMSRFTDGKGRSTVSWWDNPPSSIDHVGSEYISYRHPNVMNIRHETFVKKRFKEEMTRFKRCPDGWRKYEEVSI